MHSTCLLYKVMVEWQPSLLVDKQCMGSVLVNFVTLALSGVSNESKINFLNTINTIHCTPNPIVLTYKVIKIARLLLWEFLIADSYSQDAVYTQCSIDSSSSSGTMSKVDFGDHGIP